jgi:hypothetical protein
MKTVFKTDKSFIASMYNTCAKELGWKTITPKDVSSNLSGEQLLARAKQGYQDSQEHLDLSPL